MTTINATITNEDISANLSEQDISVSFNTSIFPGFRVTEEDGSPDVTGVKKLIFSNGTVTDNGDSSVSIDVDPIIPEGTAQGQLLYWDVSNNQWQPSDETKLVWDDTNNRLGIGIDNPLERLHIQGTGGDGALRIADSTSSARLDLVSEAINGNNWQLRSVSNGNFDINQLGGGIVFKLLAPGGAALFQNFTDSTTAFQILDADGGTPIFNIDTTNERVGIGTNNPGALLDVNGQMYINTSIFASNAPANNFINFNAAGFMQQSGGSGVIYDINGGVFRVRSDPAQTIRFDITASGVMNHYGQAIFQNATNSTTAFQVLDADGGAPIFNVDTFNERIGIGTAAPAPTSLLNIHRPSSSGSWLRFTNTTTGQTDTDGTLMGIDGNEIFNLIDYENNGINFKMNGGTSDDDVLKLTGKGTMEFHYNSTDYISFSVDTNADITITPSLSGGIRFQPTTDISDFLQILDADGGNPIFSIDSINERVGIGLSTPGVVNGFSFASSRHHLYNASASSYYVTETDLAGGFAGILMNRKQSVTNERLWGFDLQPYNANTQGRFSINKYTDAGTPTSLVTVLPNGNVGINERDPQQLLHLVKDQNAQTGIRVDNGTTGTIASSLFDLRIDTLSNSDRALFGALSSGYTAITGWGDSFIISAQSGLGGGVRISGVNGISFESGGSGSTFEVGSINTSGHVIFQNSVDSTTGFQILDADGGIPIFNVDTTNERVGIRTTTPNATLDIAGSKAEKITTVNSATYTAQLTDRKINVNYSSTGVCTITIPAAASLFNSTDNTCITYIIQDISGAVTTNSIIIQGTGGETINGATNYTMYNNYQSVIIDSDGSNLFLR